MDSFLSPELWLLLASLLAVGLFAGFIGGLFGIGGGIVIVPALYATFGFLEVPEEYRIKLAVGTSLATIIITSFRSVSAHYRHGAVDVPLLKKWAPWIGAGAIIGALSARFIPADGLTGFFAIGALLVALNKAFIQQTEKGSMEAPAQVPGGIVPIGFGGGIGFVSSLMGIGGGVMGVIVLTSFGRSIHQAIATAAGFGLAIAIPGTLGFIIAGAGAENLPFLSAGFISIPAFIVIASMTTFAAPWGANFAHRLDKGMLNRVFAIYLVITAILLMKDILS